jgi:hypothetical protein
MGINAKVYTTAGATALLLLSQAAHAKTQVSTIVGAYDDTCSTLSCLPSVPAGITKFATNGGNPNDNPNLYIYNTTGSSFTNVTLTLTGYQGRNIGATQTLTFGSIGANTAYKLVWGGGNASNSGGPLFNYDYDDEYGQTLSASGPVTGGSGGVGVCQPYYHIYGNYCAQTGNFDVAFSADLNGNPITSDFGPTYGQAGFGNVQGAFVGWEGISPAGYSESTYDAHGGTAPGTLADIFTGTSGSQTSHAVPEPSALVTLAGALSALGLLRRKRKTS